MYVSANILKVQQAPKIDYKFSYYAAGSSGTFDNQRTHVLKGSSTSIWDSSWSYASKLGIPQV